MFDQMVLIDLEGISHKQRHEPITYFPPERFKEDSEFAEKIDFASHGAPGFVIPSERVVMYSVGFFLLKFVTLQPDLYPTPWGNPDSREEFP